MTTGGSTGGGVLQTTWPGSIDAPPFARAANLRAMAERLRAEDWPIENSLQERSEADPNNESVLDLVPPAP